MAAVTLTRQGRIGLITVDNPPVNALSHAVRSGLADAIGQAADDSEIAAIVLICTGRTFIAGADIREFGGPLQPPLLNDLVFTLEASAKPLVAAIHGTALGGGLEVAMACHFRVALGSAKVGLPEVKLGILPGAGGTQRLPRLVGVETALTLITEGNEISAAKAKSIGLIDAIIDGDLEKGAIRFAEQLLADGTPIRRTGALPVEIPDPAIFDTFKKSLARRQRGFAAPLACVDAVKLAVDYPIEEASRREYALCLELMQGSQSRAQRHAFFAEREVAKVPGLPADTPTRNIATVGVIGAGVMGTGIAQCFITAGLPVVLVGRSQASADKAVGTIRKQLAGMVAKGTLAQGEMDRRLAQLTPASGTEAVKDADLLIEAASEDMATKTAIFEALGSIAKPGAILATNTSYLDIDALAEASGRPEDVVGMHFFNPANVMRLLENVRAAKTAPDVLATVMKIGKAIRKVSVLVGMGDGFLVNRMLSKRSRECMFLLEDGATPWQIDKVIYDFGFPLGPYQLSDLAGIDVQYAARKARWERLSERERAANIVDQLYALGRYGQKTGAGYYTYDESRKAVPDPATEALIVAHSAARGITRRTITDQEILERCLYAIINEGAKILDEGAAARPHDIDIAWLTGLGFPAYRGGPMYYADEIGLKTVYDGLLRYSDLVGAEFFAPAPLIEKLVRDGKGFYRA